MLIAINTDFTAKRYIVNQDIYKQRTGKTANTTSIISTIDIFSLVLQQKPQNIAEFSRVVFLENLYFISSLYLFFGLFA
jgi:hypothetical protein